jgi:hypothetical protein
VNVSLFPNWIDTTQERIVDLSDGGLELRTEPVVFGGRTRVVRMRWSRVRKDAES